MKVSQHGCRSLFLLIFVSFNLIHHEYGLKINIGGLILGAASLVLVSIYFETSIRYNINIIVLYIFLCFSLINKNLDVSHIFISNHSYESKLRIKVVENDVAIENGYKYHKVKINNVPLTLSFMKGKSLFLKLKGFYELKKDNIYDIAGVMGFLKPYVEIDCLVFERINYLEKVKKTHSLEFNLYKKINNSKLSQDCKGFIFAFLLGNKSYLSGNQISTFKASGTMHLFAVSGLHIGCLYTILYFCGNFFLKNNKITVVISLALLFLYVDLVGYSVSSVRAFLMIAAWCLVKLIQRRTDALYVMVFSMLFCIAENSTSIYSIAFQLSFTVVLTIIWLCSLRNITNYHSIENSYVRNLLFVGYASYWGSFLLILDHFDFILTISFFINLILIPFVGIIMIILILYIVSLYIFQVDNLFFIIDYIYSFVYTFLDYSGKIPFAKVNINLEINDCFHLIYFFSIMFFFYKFKRTKVKLLFLPIFCLTTMLISLIMSRFV